MNANDRRSLLKASPIPDESIDALDRRAVSGVYRFENRAPLVYKPITSIEMTGRIRASLALMHRVYRTDAV